MKAHTNTKRRALIRPASRPLAPLVESPTSVYVVGVSIGIGCSALVLLLLLGALAV